MLRYDSVQAVSQDSGTVSGDGNCVGAVTEQRAAAARRMACRADLVVKPSWWEPFPWAASGAARLKGPLGGATGSDAVDGGETVADVDAEADVSPARSTGDREPDPVRDGCVDTEAVSLRP